jgi:HSP20 family molecular chaperone IbpA
MHGSRLGMMLDHVRSIHRAVTGSDPPEPAQLPEGADGPPPEQVMQHFAELEAFARTSPLISERVPQFSFSPPLDIIGTERELIVEIGVPGIERGDVEVELSGDVLMVLGARSTTQALDGRIYFHAEIPRGPFRRVVRLPEPVGNPTRVEVESGVVRVRLPKIAKTSRPQA